MMGITKAMKCCQICAKWLYAHVLGLFSNDHPGLTLTIFMTGSDLFPDASVWVAVYKAFSANVFPSLFQFSMSSALG